MSIRLGNNIVAGRSPYQPSLFDFKWADHVLTDPQWVRADTNLWHNRSVFTSAYDHLLADIQGKEAQSETVEGIIITYYLASDGHKICLSDQASYLDGLYEKTGVAWYYMIDTTTQSFKVPRSKWNVVGIRDGAHDVVGKFETFALPNAASEGTAKTAASQMYLYFYIGNFTQTAIENTAGANLADIEEVMDEGIEAIETMINSQYHPDIFDIKWSDHILNDIQWLRADTFSWQSGVVYETAYNHLVADIEGKSLSTDYIDNITIQYYLADDGHKICPVSQSDNLVALYNTTGIAWYYLLDTTNTRFKLPRTKYGFQGIKDSVGKYDEAGLPNITGYMRAFSEYNLNNTDFWLTNKTLDGAFYWNAELEADENQRMGTSTNLASGSNDTSRNVHFDASRSSSIYGNSDTVQSPATEMYLYFYVGNFLQSAVVNTAALNMELFNGKVDIGHEVIEFQAPTAANNYTWYRKYADGWIEQGGHDTTTRTTSSALSADATIVFPVEFSDTGYTFNATVNGTYCGIQEKAGYARTTTELKVDILATYPNNTYTSNGFDWFACGMAA
jgi:hypothetical protein